MTVPSLWNFIQFWLVLKFFFQDGLHTCELDCGKRYKRVGSYVTHLKSNHGVKFSEDFVCQNCGESYPTYKSLKQHLDKSAKCAIFDPDDNYYYYS